MKPKLFLTTVLLAFIADAHACKCGWDETIQDAFKRRDLVVYGKVINIDTVLLPETIAEEDVNQVRERLRDDQRQLQYFEETHVIKVELEIVENYKGDNTSKRVLIYTPMLSATCGYRFKEGNGYIVYGSRMNFLSFLFNDGSATGKYEKENVFWTTHCTRTAEYSPSEAGELRILRKQN